MEKTDSPEEVKNIMYAATQIAAALGQMGEPFIPFASAKILAMMNSDKMDWNSIENADEFIAAAHQLGESSLIFAKIEDEAIAAQMKKLNDSKVQNNMTNPDAVAQKELVSFDDFQKMDIRIGTILEAKKVEKADKLFELSVDTGIDVRTIVSGIAEHFTLEEIVGKQAMVLANLAPRKIRGIESHGMLLFADKADGKLTFVKPEEETPNGVQVG